MDKLRKSVRKRFTRNRQRRKPRPEEREAFGRSKPQSDSMCKRLRELTSRISTSSQRRRMRPAEDTPSPTGAELVQKQDAQTQTSEELQEQYNRTILKNYRKAADGHKEATDIIAQLKSEKSRMEEELSAYRKIVQDMGEVAITAHRECDELRKECEQLKAKLRATKH